MRFKTWLSGRSQSHFYLRTQHPGAIIHRYFNHNLEISKEPKNTIVFSSSSQGSPWKAREEVCDGWTWDGVCLRQHCILFLCYSYIIWRDQWSVQNICSSLSKGKNRVQNFLTFHNKYSKGAPSCMQCLLRKVWAFIVLYTLSVPCKYQLINLSNITKQIKLFIFSEIDWHAEFKKQNKTAP